MRLPPSTRIDGPPDGHGTASADVLVVGAGIAGLYAAVVLAERAPGLDIAVLDKGRPTGSGSSPWAQGGVAVAFGPDDGPDLHAADTIRAGDGLCDPVAVDVLAREGPGHVRRLVELGADFDREAGGDLHLAREGGQTVARSVHRADATGAEIVRALREVAAAHVTRLEATALALTRTQARVSGAWGVTPDGPVHVSAGAVLLATGGCGGLFAATTNQSGATADGVSLAWNAGAAVRDLEFVQFHPTALAARDGDRPGWRLLLTEALRGAGATLHDDDGERFMIGVHRDAELAPRHVVAREIVARGGAWLDATHLGAKRLAEEFPTALNGARELGFDLAVERVPVTPAAHYQVGGVRTDLDGRTTVPGLWAAGEVASTGVHGANRMAGNSLLEALVFGGRSAASIAATPAAVPDPRNAAPPGLGAAVDDLETVRATLRQAMWDGCGPGRDARRLEALARTLDGLRERLGRPAADPDHVELVHAVTAAGLMVRSALLRTETRGGHVRDDHPDRDPAWDDAHLDLTPTHL
ncbi:MAG: L-aspartate oxidase [Nitriliruptorales bacterium]